MGKLPLETVFDAGKRSAFMQNKKESTRNIRISVIISDFNCPVNYFIHISRCSIFSGPASAHGFELIYYDIYIFDASIMFSFTKRRPIMASAAIF